MANSESSGPVVRNGELWITFEGGEEDTTVRPSRLSRKELARLRKAENRGTDRTTKRPRSVRRRA